MKYYLKSVFPLLFIVVFLSNGFAQPTESYFDNILKKTPKDTTYIRTVEKYVWYLCNSFSNIPKADSLLKTTEKLALRLKDYRGLVKIYFYQGLILYRQGKNDESIKFIRKAQEIVEKQNLPPTYRQRILSALSNYYIIRFDSENALKYALQAIELTEKYHLKEYITPSYLVACQVYKGVDASKSEYYYKKALEMAYHDTDSTQRYLAENTIAGYYIEKGNFKEALTHAQKSMIWVEKFGRKANFSMAWNLLAEVYIDLKEPQKAKLYIDKSVKLAEEIKDYNRMSDAYMIVGYYYFYYEPDLKKSEYYYKKAIEICKKMENTSGVHACYESLVMIYEKDKKFREALEYDKKARILKDSLYSKDWALKLNKLEIEKKETNLKLLEEKNKNAVFQRNALILGTLALLIISAGMIYFIVTRSKFKRFEEHQKLRNKLSADLHDEIGSSLSSISMLSELVAYQQQKGNPKPEIMQQVSNDARSIIEKMDDIIWTLNPKNDSVQNLETRLKTFAIPLFESKGIDFSFQFSPDLEQLKIDSTTRGDIYLILKEAINNLIKYSQCKTANIEAWNDEKQVIFVVKDDGIGFDANAETQRNGLRNMKMRAEKIGGKLTINSVVGSGTEICISLKV